MEAYLWMQHILVAKLWKHTDGCSIYLQQRCGNILMDAAYACGQGMAASTQPGRGHRRISRRLFHQKCVLRKKTFPPRNL